VVICGNAAVIPPLYGSAEGFRASLSIRSSHADPGEVDHP